MYKKILVPMDGSELAESVLPHVESVAKGCEGASVVFIRAVEPVNLPAAVAAGGSPIVAGGEIAGFEQTVYESSMKEAKDYLGNLLLAGSLQGIHADVRVVEGRPAETIARYAEENAFDLIILSTHGRSGLSRLVWGSTADKLLQLTCLPLMMIRAPGCGVLCAEE
jgi:nucleotide-binding universal stress UspA family protein